MRLALVACCAAALTLSAAFSPSPSRRTATIARSSPSPEKDDDMFGVSFMGGDPCASSYNDDPFDEQDARPDAMAELRRRVKALEDARLAKATADDDAKPPKKS